MPNFRSLVSSPFWLFTNLREGVSPRRAAFLMLMLMVFVLPSAAVFAQEEGPTLDLSTMVDSLFEKINLFIPLATEVMGLPFAIMIAFAIIGAVGMLLVNAFRSLKGSG